MTASGAKVETLLEGLKGKVDDALASASQAEQENHAERQQRIAAAVSATDSAAAELEHKAADTAAAVQSKWHALRASAQAKRERVAAQIEDREHKRDVRLARSDAERADQFAIDAIDFAQLAIENAKVSVLDAIDARIYASQFDGEAEK